MSLEAVIEANTSAIRELIEAIKTGVPTTAAQVAAVATEATPAKSESKSAKAEKVDAANVAEPKTEAVKVEEKAAAATEQPAPPSYKDASEAIVALSKGKGRDAAVAILNKFGVSKLPDLDPSRFADIIDAAKAALEA
ncbi:hypothetical protein EAY64_05450 [Aquitalea palustris]|uniref:rRNA biogenesis protein rrp5 n=1 Tax=Aquitalea palustris TaxID=2480983 RepID=A0A454JL03_9NEIS|nr:hypothetical protein [Aquitalea palustris]RMD00042.1 hypothetical protein EAY64_05450 [Aquitalea palustris]